MAEELRSKLKQLPELTPLAELCGRYVTNVTLRQGEWERSGWLDNGYGGAIICHPKEEKHMLYVN